MNPIVFALRHPVTVVTAMAALVLGCGLALVRMKVDIFPALNLPVIYVCQPYGGMDASQLEGLITNYYEYHFLYMSGIHHVESKNVQGAALMKVVFHPGTDMAQAMAEVVAGVNRSRASTPPGTVPPFVVRLDTGSVPVGYLVLDSPTRGIGEIQDLATLRVRPIFASLPGVTTPPPFGGSPRAIVVNVDPDRLRSYNLSPDDVITALSAGNTASPSGNVRVRDQMPIVPVNSMVNQASELGAIPIRPGSSVHLRDVAAIEDANDVQAGYALVNGRRSVYMLVTKRADASTLAVVRELKAALPRLQQAVPEDVRVRFEFDQSPVVTRAMWGVAAEGLIGAALTGLMVLLFLRDWRSVIVVVLNIPLALLAAVIALWLCGQSVNLMTLGGLALAVGILVDESTVEVENIHTQLSRTDSVARAVRRGNAETAVPRLLAMLCVLAVFLPSFFMEGPARAMFVPLSLAVGFSMIASYVLSSSLVPVLSVWLLRHHSTAVVSARGWLVGDLLQSAMVGMWRLTVRLRWLLVPGYLAAAAAVFWLVGRPLGTEIFPAADTGQFQLRLRAPTGTRIERTEEIALRALDVVGDLVGRENVESSVGYVGAYPPQYPIQYIFNWTSGPEEASLRIALKRGCGVRVADLKARLRAELPGRLQSFMADRLRQDGLPPERIAERLAGLRLSLEAADIINEVMSFGSPTPVEVVVSGPKMAENLAHAKRIHAELAKLPALKDLQYAQALDYPAIEVRLDRERAGQSGVTAAAVAQALVAATSSSRFVTPNFWRDPNTGVGYFVQVQVPPARMNAAQEVGLIPIKPGDGAAGLLVRDVAQVHEGTTPGEIDRFNMRRLVSLTANLAAGVDLGAAGRQVDAAIRAAGEPPRGVIVDVHGQIEPMHVLFGGLGVGLALAVAVILLLLTAYFQSLRLSLVAVAAVPAVLCGVALMLWFTNTTINLQSFMGAIMSIGVAVANAILLVTFAERARRGGVRATAAAVEGVRGRLRPILMTSCAMVAGMVPMALGLGEGGEQTAPLGRAVIGGLLAATATTLLVLPAVFALAMGLAPARSASLDPDDPDSRFYDGIKSEPQMDADERG
jgi:multidrug efflux pump subunit AcrB